MNFEEFYKDRKSASTQITWKQEPETGKETVLASGPSPDIVHGVTRILAAVAAQHQRQGLANADRLIVSVCECAKEMAAIELESPFLAPKK